ncbi:MAG: DUF6057 family protein [Bacteroidota bacterium]|jgi:hypothetical protein|nr:DUF6057 family protein [Bacteroidota bacterium]HHU97146.1 EscU/YscU/HrcU family type III secretion system export apparatus switch protein [Petrimonas sp.]
MKTVKKLLPFTFWLVTGIAVFLFLQHYFEFHFYYVEQLQLFLYHRAFLSDLLFSFGGLSELISRWLLQFFIHPKMGALITTALLLAIAILMNSVTKKINPKISLILIPLLSSVFIFFLHLNHNYYIAGTVAYILALAAFLFYLYIQRPIANLIVSTLFTLLLFWWAGPAAFLFAVTVTLWQFLTTRKRVLHALTPLFVFVILAFVSVRLSWVGDYRQTFLPAIYFHPKLTPPPIIYFPWGLMLLLVAISHLLRNLNISRRLQYVVVAGQLLIVPVIVYTLIPTHGQHSSAEYKKMDYYLRMEGWNDIIEGSKKPITNLLHAYYLNIALMETNQLGHQFLMFDQKGTKGLVPIEDKGLPSLVVSNELNFTLGDIAASQRFAFEANLTVSKTGSPRLYKRLIQTNLINGEYAVAEKYIQLLEQTHAYKKWAMEQRRFLYNDKAITDDPLLGKKRRGLPTDNYLLASHDPVHKVNSLLKADPTNRSAFDYLASIFLFEKQVSLFIELVDEYCTTEETLADLPEKFQEGIIVYYESDPSAWERYNVNPRVTEKYINYKQLYLENRSDPRVADILYRSFGNTYWLYLMFND